MVEEHACELLVSRLGINRTVAEPIASPSGFKFSQLEMSECATFMRRSGPAHRDFTEVVLSVLLSAFRFETSERPITWNASAVIYPTTGGVSTQPEMFLKLSKIA